MGNILFLAHRLPYPPNKGDKVRSYHLLRHLTRRHRVFLGTFVDDPDDLQHLPTVRGLCEEMHVERIHPRPARVASLQGLLRGEALSVSYYRSNPLLGWVEGLRRRVQLDVSLVFSSAMGPFAEAAGAPMVVDFVDVDSAKWAQYAGEHAWPMSWLYRREGRTLLAHERRLAHAARASFFVTDKECALFEQLAPDLAGRTLTLGNGVDADYFAPQAGRDSPFAAGEIPLVFTGAMDYWPNIDAVCWFVAEMLPRLRARWPALRFHIVGRSPAPAVQALASAEVAVTGTVPDVRPYLQHAAVVVAPLRLARGVQNKVLEAMAMARPVVAASTCVEAIDAQAGEHLLAATDTDDYVGAIDALLADRPRGDAIGAAARSRVLSHYGWDARLQGLDRHLEAAA